VPEAQRIFLLPLVGKWSSWSAAEQGTGPSPLCGRLIINLLQCHVLVASQWENSRLLLGRILGRRSPIRFPFPFPVKLRPLSDIPPMPRLTCPSVIAPAPLPKYLLEFSAILTSKSRFPGFLVEAFLQRNLGDDKVFPFLFLKGLLSFLLFRAGLS